MPHLSHQDTRPVLPVLVWGAAPAGLAALRQVLACVVPCGFVPACVAVAPYQRVRRRTRGGALTYGRCVVCDHRTSHRRGGRWIHDVCAEGPCSLCAPHAFARHTPDARWEVRSW